MKHQNRRPAQIGAPAILFHATKSVFIISTHKKRENAVAIDYQKLKNWNFPDLEHKEELYDLQMKKDKTYKKKKVTQKLNLKEKDRPWK